MPVLPQSPPTLTTRLAAWWSRLAAEIAGGSRARWLAIGFVLCALLPGFFSWPEFPVTPETRGAWDRYWASVVQKKIDDPWFDYAKEFSGEKNEAKRNFRVVVPLVASLTHTGQAGVEVVRFALQAVLLLGLLLAAERACGGDRLAALGVALTVAGTYAGTCVWRDICRWFDNCTYAWLALALVARNPWLAAGAVMLGAFTDERALLVVPLLMLFHAFTGSPRRTLVGLAASIPLYVAVRIGLGRMFHLGMPTGSIATLGIVTNNLDHASAGFWFALEGGWLLVAMGMWRATALGRTAAAAGLALATLMPVGAALAVGDFTRSAAFVFPATLAAVALLRQTLADDVTRLRRIVGWAAVVSLVVPNVFIMDNDFHETSAPVHLLVDWLRAGATAPPGR